MADLENEETFTMVKYSFHQDDQKLVKIVKTRSTKSLLSLNSFENPQKILKKSPQKDCQSGS
jgi:hypothetical protein